MTTTSGREDSQQVITWQTPAGEKLDICKQCEAKLEGNWPRTKHGEYCQVSHGLHLGTCGICNK